MNTMMEIGTHDAVTQNGPAVVPQHSMAYTLKRTGARPIRFEGSELAMAMSYTSTVPYWYEVNLYRASDESFVAAVRLFYQAEDMQDTIQAWQAGSLEDAIDILVQYDAARDVQVPFEMNLGTAPPAETAAIALQLMAQINAARHHYQSLIGEFLYDLETGQ